MMPVNRMKQHDEPTGRAVEQLTDETVKLLDSGAHGHRSQVSMRHDPNLCPPEDKTMVSEDPRLSARERPR
jgi:hypothetical protein